MKNVATVTGVSSIFSSNDIQATVDVYQEAFNTQGVFDNVHLAGLAMAGYSPVQTIQVSVMSLQLRRERVCLPLEKKCGYLAQ